MSVMKDAVMSILHMTVGSGHDWPHETEVLAEDLASQTNLTEAEAVVAAGDIKGLSDRDIQHRMGFSPHRVTEIRKQLRERYRKLYEEKQVQDVTDKTLKDWADSR